MEGRRPILFSVGQRDPGLQTVQGSALGAQGLEPFGVGDAPARRHPIDLAGQNRLFEA